MTKLTPAPDPARCCEPVDLDAMALKDGVANWLAANGAGCRFLLAYTERGVVWGRLDTDGLHTSHDAFPNTCRADLSVETLWQVRLFGLRTELLLWRADDAWHAKRFSEPEAPLPSIDEAQMLWGTSGTRDLASGFSLLQDGAEGLRHAVPLIVPDDAFVPIPKAEQPQRPVRLLLRHYLSYTAAGVAYIAMSRLVDLYLAKEALHAAA